MKIAICQLKILFEKKAENINRAEAFVKESADNGSSLILFPEMSFTGFSMNTQLVGEESPKTVKKMQMLAKKYHIAIGFGWVQYKTDSENHYTIIDAYGRILGDYVKIHPFRFAGEHQHFVGGTHICTFRFENFCFGLTICYDLRFPELYRKLSEQADIILVPAHWPVQRLEHWNVLLKARAIENQIYVLGINCTGWQNDIEYRGESQVINPNGEIVVEAMHSEAMIYVTPQDVEKFREKFSTRKDWRPDLYATFYSKKQ